MIGFAPRVIRAPRKLDEPRRELDQYFAGDRREFELPLDWQLIRGFGRKVLSAAARVPYGSVSTYKQMASEAGSPRAARAASRPSTAKRRRQPPLRRRRKDISEMHVVP